MQSMSELEIPACSATACANNVPWAEDFRSAVSSSCSNAARVFVLDKVNLLPYEIYILDTKIISVRNFLTRRNEWSKSCRNVPEKH